MTKYFIKWTQKKLAGIKPDPAKRKHYPDPSTPGLYIRVYPSGAKTFYFVYRMGGRGTRLQWLKIASFGDIPLTKVRKLAQFYRGQVVSGIDPTIAISKVVDMGCMSIKKMANKFLAEYVVNLKKKSQVEYHSSINNRILPKLGNITVHKLTREVVAEWHSSGTDGNGIGAIAANRALAILSSMLTQAEIWGLIPQGSNPCRYVKPFREKPRLRDIQPRELEAIGQAMKDERILSVHNIWVLSAIKIIALCAGRVSEVLSLRRDTDIYLDEGYAIIHDHKTSNKTGSKRMELPPTAVSILRGLPGKNGSPWYFPGKTGNVPLTMGGLHYVWRKICRLANIRDLHLHDFRSFAASEGLERGIDARTTAKLLGHSNSQTTERHYLKVREKKAAQAIAQISSSIANAFGL